MTISGSKLVAYGYPSQGIDVVLAQGPAGDLAVSYVTLSTPNRDTVAGVGIGASAATLQQRLGKPRAVTPEPSGGSWWDYAAYGLSFHVMEGAVKRCLVGGRR